METGAVVKDQLHISQRSCHRYGMVFGEWRRDTALGGRSASGIHRAAGQAESGVKYQDFGASRIVPQAGFASLQNGDSLHVCPDSAACSWFGICHPQSGSGDSRPLERQQGEEGTPCKAEQGYGKRTQKDRFAQECQAHCADSLWRWRHYHRTYSHQYHFTGKAFRLCHTDGCLLRRRW